MNAIGERIKRVFELLWITMPNETELNAQTPVIEALAPPTATGPYDPPDRFQFLFCIEQKPGDGEDTEPILSISLRGDQGVLAVFDGMGGAGGTIYKHNAVNRTGAYIAARLASNVTKNFFANPTAELYFSAIGRPEAIAHALGAKLSDTFRTEVAKLESAPPRLGGKMMRRLPTTMACLHFESADNRYDEATYTVYWAGDSRAYLLSPNQGLQQISIDDLKSGGDALQNLLEDSPMSNCINADGSFQINAISGRCHLPMTFLVATDGCFNFSPTPAHLEYALLDTLLQSSTSHQWGDAVKNRLHAIAGDDLSLALVSVGWTSFNKLKSDYTPRRTDLWNRFIKPIDDLETQINTLADQHKQTLIHRDRLREELWNLYKQGYELFHRQDQQDKRATDLP